MMPYISDPFRRSCKEGYSRYWFPTNSLYRPDEDWSFVNETATSSEDCIRTCEEYSPECFAVEYDTNSDFCHMYLRSKAYNYKVQLIEDEDIHAFTSVCSTGNPQLMSLCMRFPTMSHFDM